MTRTDRYATILTPGDRDMYIERIVDAPRDRVWAAYTVPGQIAQWWGRGNRLVVERFEFERGGQAFGPRLRKAYRHLMDLSRTQFDHGEQIGRAHV